MFPNVSQAFTAGSHFILAWTLVMLFMVWWIPELRYQWSLYQGDFPAEAKALRKTWRKATAFVLGLIGIAIFGWMVSGILLSS